MPLTVHAYDTFVAQDLSQLTECRALPIAPDFPEHNSWLNSFVLNWMLRIPMTKDKAALAFALIRRAEGAIDDYEEARGNLQSLVTGKRNIALYFRCLRRFESSVAMVYQGLEFGRNAVSTMLHAPGDGSPHQRLNEIYNRSRHANPQALPAGQLHIVWIRNDGLHTDGAHVTFDELREMIRQLGSIADKIATGQVPTQPGTP